MFGRLPDPQAEAVTLAIDGRAIETRASGSVAAGLFAAGLERCRTKPVSGTPRAPYCMMGVCFECLVTMDVVGNRQACLIRVREGMRVETQEGKRKVGR